MSSRENPKEPSLRLLSHVEADFAFGGDSGAARYTPPSALLDPRFGEKIDLKRVADELEVLTQASSTDVVERTQVGPLVSVLAAQHHRWGLPLTCLMVGLILPARSRKLYGDDAVVELARFARRWSRSTDRIGFYLGDCVTLLMSGENIQGGMIAAHRLVRQWSTWAGMSGLTVDAGISVGVSVLGECTDSGNELLRYAHLALEEARHSGQGAICHYGESRPGVPTALEASPQFRHIFRSFSRLAAYSGHRVLRGAYEHLTRLTGIDLENAQRVADGALRISQQLDMSPDQEVALATAALLRDVGMTQVPPPILTQREPLVPEQRRLIQEHPQQTLSSLRGIELPDAARDIILHHHERFDGAGYPGRIGGREIPMGARVISVVDAYEAMISNRAYRRQVFSPEGARTELRQGAGTQFDPELVELFLSA